MGRAVLSALGSVHPAEGGTDVVSAGRVKNLHVDEDGNVSFSLLVSGEGHSSVVQEARKAAEGIDGIGAVRVSVQLPQAAPGGGPPPGKGPGLKPGSVPAPTPKPGILPEVDRIIAVSSGKGGVGKSMVASNLAAVLAKRGLRVGLLDADVYGPNIPLMFGESRRPAVVGEPGQERIQPLEAHGVRLMSLGFLMEKEQAAIMRGPLISGILRQFLEQVDWRALDILIVDMPPGTGDAQLSLVQNVDLDGAVMVTTPQEVSVGDVRRGIKMFERVNTKVLGIVENMSGLRLPDGQVLQVFGSGGGSLLSEEMGIPLLGTVPLDPAVREAADRGEPSVLALPEAESTAALETVADAVWSLVESSSRRSSPV